MASLEEIRGALQEWVAKQPPRSPPSDDQLIEGLVFTLGTLLGFVAGITEDELLALMPRSALSSAELSTFVDIWRDTLTDANNLIEQAHHRGR